MAANSRSNQQQRYAMRERKKVPRKEVYRPNQDVPAVSHSAREKPVYSSASSPLSSIRSDAGSVNEHVRDELSRADDHDHSALDRQPAMQEVHFVGMKNAEQEHHARERGRGLATSDASLDGLSAASGIMALDSATRYPSADRPGRSSYQRTQRSRSASPRPVEETSSRSRSPFHQARQSGARTAREIEEEKARIDLETASFEAEYQQLLLEESIQKRNYFKAKVEEQKRKMKRYSSEMQGSSVSEPSVREPLTEIDNEATIHPGRRARMEQLPTTSPARSENVDELKDFNPPAGPRGSLRGSMGNGRAILGERHDTATPGPGLTIKGTAAVATPPTLAAASQREKGANDLQRRILATLAKGYAPRAGKVPAPRRTLRYAEAKATGENRLYTENYGGTRQEDLALCKWVFDTEKECPHGKECTCRHEPLDDEELEWIRTNPVPPKKNIAFHPGKWLERLLQNYSNPRMPKVSKFDRA